MENYQLELGWIQWIWFVYLLAMYFSANSSTGDQCDNHCVNVKFISMYVYYVFLCVKNVRKVEMSKWWYRNQIPTTKRRKTQTKKRILKQIDTQQIKVWIVYFSLFHFCFSFINFLPLASKLNFDGQWPIKHF